MTKKTGNDPNRLYRFLRAEHAIQAIETGFLKIGRLAELNDPFEFIPVIEDAPAGKLSIYENFFIAACNDFFGLLCFSNVVTDPVVWSHYAEGHGGIALGFQYPSLQSLVEKGEYTRVTYSDDRPKINRHEFARGLTVENIAVAKAILSTKAKSWECEKEYRFFVELSSSNLLTRDGMYWYPISKALLVDVVPGLRCPIDDDYLRKTLSAGGFSNAKVRRAIRSRSQYEVELSP